MRTNDVSRAKLQKLILEIKNWAAKTSHAARITEHEEAYSWHLAVAPNIKGGCPVELMFTGDELHDLRVAGEGCEDAPITSYDMFIPLLSAIADGNVRQRYWTSSVTGDPMAIETIVDMENGETWSVTRALHQDAPAATNLDDDETVVCTERHFLPYYRLVLRLSA